MTDLTKLWSWGYNHKGFGLGLHRKGYSELSIAIAFEESDSGGEGGCCINISLIKLQFSLMWF